MRATFTAAEGGHDETDDVMSCGVAGDGHYLILQRNVAGSTDDARVYLEYDDQLNGCYGCVVACRVNRGWLSVDLANPVGRQAITGFDVALKLRPEVFAAVRSALRRLLHGHAAVTDAEENESLG